MSDLIGKNGLQDLRSFFVADFPPLGRKLSQEIELAGLESAILQGQASRERIEHAGDTPLKIGNREFSLVATDFSQSAIESCHVPTFVPALAGELHAELPGSVRKIHQALGGNLDSSRFVVHVPVEAFTHGGRRHAGPLMHFRVAVNDLKAFFAQRIPPEGHALNRFRVFWFHLDHIAPLGNRRGRAMSHDVGVSAFERREPRRPLFFIQLQLRQLIENALHHSHGRFV